MTNFYPELTLGAIAVRLLPESGVLPLTSSLIKVLKKGGGFLDVLRTVHRSPLLHLR